MFIVELNLSLKHFSRCIEESFISSFSKKKRIQYKHKLERSEKG